MRSARLLLLSGARSLSTTVPPSAQTARMPKMPTTSQRVALTDTPCIVQMQQMLRACKRDVLSLAQGIVHWPPPDSALQAAQESLLSPQTSMYAADDGLPELRQMLREKLTSQNGLCSSEVMVTAGANQAYINVVLALLDAGDAAVLFRPYYFNHLMALQMTGSAKQLWLPPSLPDLQPDLQALRIEFERRAKAGPTGQIKLVTLVNPGNPTGVMVPKQTLQEASDLCAEHGSWLVVDNTYEHFAYRDCPPHECIEGEHVINLFSFSKAFGMMGWRVGYIAHHERLSAPLLKIQDTVIICPSVASQRVAIGALAAGRGWVDANVDSLAQQKQLVLDALAPLGEGLVHGGSGAIYLFCKLPGDLDDLEAVRWLTNTHGVCLIPGSSCGMPGHVRVCYANLPLQATREAASRLHAGLSQIASAVRAGEPPPWASGA
uniref:Aminotransferase class I/classII large domain-containing protein n=1 Tax=Coccolithus braarudii TaxID=221442 RepID=A0A7S0LII8_9EUKA|mmetsp:Transcript_38120/g.81241  ORF Transcript_38120/g.81241 Transcript_38120/m.81241 type:complete len:434 (+) Transcript_38120:10-1311(+)